MEGRHAAIDPDEVLDKPLAEITGAQLIQVLGHPDFLVGGIHHILPDKKKYELWVDEGPILHEVPLGELIKKIRGEKKKRELEVPWLDRGDPPFGVAVEALADAIERTRRST